MILKLVEAINIDNVLLPGLMDKYCSNFSKIAILDAVYLFILQDSGLFMQVSSDLSKLGKI